jgi:predicted secreted protein
MQGPNGELNGFDVLVQVQEPAGSGSFLTVGSQRGVTFAETTAPIDLSSKERREYVGTPGRYSATVSLEHLYIPAASGYLKLRTAMRSGTMVTIKRRQLNADLESASAIVTSLSENFPDQEGAVVSADFQISGPWA